MIEKISNEIAISVIAKYKAEHSNPIEAKYIHVYQITIKNNNHFPVQLLSRKWFIQESSGKQTIVNGEGVVGKTPVLQPGEEFQYVSCCPLESMIGTMEGHYKFQRLDDGSQFISRIPKFSLICPDILN